MPDINEIQLDSTDCSILFFKNEEIMKKCVAVKSWGLVPIINGSAENKEDFPGVFAALRKNNI